MDGTVSIRNIPENAEIQSIPSRAREAVRLWMSSRGQYVAVLDRHQAVQLWRVADGKPLLTKELPFCATVEFSPNDRQAAIATSDWILVIDLVTGQETQRRACLPWPMHWPSIRIIVGSR